MKLAFCNGRIFDGLQFHNEKCLLVDKGLVSGFCAESELPSDAARQDLADRLLTAGFIDIQVNGGGGVLFNDDPSPAGIRSIIEAHKAFGTTGLMVTLISDTWARMQTAAHAVEETLSAGQPGLLGIHFEGPYLSPQRAGIHDPGYFRPPDAGALELFTRPGLGKVIATVAPEEVGPDYVSRLAGAGVLVCAGHTSASYDQAMSGIWAGVRGFTHLFNAMTPFTSREPGAVGAALDDPGVWCGLINDGYHIHPASLRVALAAKKRGKMLLVTDAISLAGASSGGFELFGQKVRVEKGRCVSEEGTLAGSTLDMASAVRNTVGLGLELGEALRMASAYPADFLGLQGSMGRIFPGARADLVSLDQELRVRGVWIGGIAQVSAPS